MSVSWYCAQTLPRREDRAQLSLRELGFDACLPLVWRTIAQRAVAPWRQARRLVPMFPRYVFVAFDPDRAGWPAIFQVPAVLRLFCCRTDDAGWFPVPLADGVVEELASRSRETMAEPEAALQPVPVGSEVAVEGTRLGGICQWSSADRVRFLTLMFGERRPMEVARERVMVVS